MSPRLAAITGPLKGATFALTEEEFSIGRDPSNRLSIGDPALSRRHCLIKKEADQLKLYDLDSSNGSFVNSLPVKERLLEDGDQINIGDSLFIFSVGEGEDSSVVTPVEIYDPGLISRPTAQLRMEDVFYLQPEKVMAALPPKARTARDLNALLKISTAVNSTRSLEALQRRLLELIFEVIPAERGAILLAGEPLEEFTSAFSWNRLSGPNRPVQVSRTIVHHVIRQGVAVLSNDVQESKEFGATRSLAATKVQSLLCVPLVVFDRMLGLIYLDTSDPTVRFDQDHLQLLTAIAGIAAAALENARHVKSLEDEALRLQAEINIEHNMVGESPRMREVYQFIAKVAPTDSTVLICGESGTGKELAARAIHMNSPRAGRPFVAINCAALTETLLESELFGHEKGAFTGAVAQKKGKLEVASGGTVFLDEVGEMAPMLQAKLLRVLQAREFERVGSTRQIKVDIRLIAATNKDLESAVRDSSFRPDLYYRLNVVRLDMPPLRERREDISLLASYFVAKYSKNAKRKVSGISTETRACLTRYDWPGNVRELENAIERAVVLGSAERILPEDLPDTLLETEPAADFGITRYHDAINEVKKQLILKAVEQAGGNYTEAAKLLGVHVNYLHRLIRNLNLRAALKGLVAGRQPG
ncbi:MAG TPA: sigma 54-interacting transcriptional regulator [Blastocatellia bacterium]|nr:sigma 54-interacting transcriptional regulator [Blastocatellia bacterium]